MITKIKSAVGFMVLLAVCQSQSALACAACYGNSDSPLAQGMNWGIFTLLGVVVFVLASVASFFVFLAWKAAAVVGVDAGSIALPDKD